MVVDFPRVGGPALTRAEEDASGQIAGIPGGLLRRTKSSTGTTSEGGTLEWVVIRTSCLQQSKVTDARWEKETRWIYYDRENFQIFRKAGDSQAMELVDEGRHGLASLRRVPVFQMKVSPGLWLMNKAASAATGALQ